MTIVRIPTPLRRLTGGRAEVHAAGTDLRSVLADLDATYPGLAGRLLDEDGRLYGFVHVFVDDEDVRHRGGLDTPVASDAVIVIVPAVAGG